MSAFQVLATVGTVLGLLLTAALTITGWIIAGVKGSLRDIRKECEEQRKELERVHLTMVKEYVQNHDLTDALGRIDKTLDKMAVAWQTAGEKIEGLALALAKIEGASGIGGSRRDG